MMYVIHTALIVMLILALAWALMAIGVLIAVHLSPLLLILYVPIALGLTIANTLGLASNL